jgi:hypothetical protein
MVRHTDEHTLFTRKTRDGRVVCFACWCDKDGRRLRRSPEKTDEREAAVIRTSLHAH